MVKVKTIEASFYIYILGVFWEYLLTLDLDSLAIRWDIGRWEKQ